MKRQWKYIYCTCNSKPDNQYIFKLAQLHSNIIFENEYVEKLLIRCIKVKFNTVLLTPGRNQSMGAFPLLGFADRIVLVAYPNEEMLKADNIIEYAKVD